MIDQGTELVIVGSILIVVSLFLLFLILTNNKGD